MNNTARKASLVLDLSPSFTPLILDFTENAAKAFGLTDSDAARVRLAGEEVFGYLCQTAKTGSEITVEALNNLYNIEIRFTFKARSFDPYAFNITASVSPEDGQMENLGLLIGSRSVDRFSIMHGQADGLILSLVKNKTYPSLPAEVCKQVIHLDGFSIIKPDDEMVKQFVRNGVCHCEITTFPPAFRIPARMADMVTHGDYHLLVACGTGIQAGDIGGGIVWHYVGKGMIQFYGPYIFDQPLHADIARMLVDSFLSVVAKTGRSGTFGHYTTPDLPPGYFEFLGQIMYRLEDGTDQVRQYFYRQLKEDTGSHVWASEQLEPFLDEMYSRLCLPRRITPASFEGEKRDSHSVFSVKFDRSRSSVNIKPVWDGEDCADNLAAHVRAFREEDLENIYFDLDLGISWQAKLIPVLFADGFKPVLLLPYAGHADIVIFQYGE